MESLANLFIKLLLSWFGTQVIFSGIFIGYLRLFGKTQVTDSINLPKASVILSLRGADPFLENCLRAIAHQNYPDYNIKIVVDSLEDPAWNVVNRIVNELNIKNISVSVLQQVPETCSLKCAAIVQAVANLEPDCAVVVLVDADAVVHRNWLRDLIIPLAPPNVGATTGNRWYLPTGQYWGSCIRYLWNISAVVQMFLYGIAWGGSLAIKTDVIRITGLMEKWSQAYADDTPLRNILAKHKFKVRFVPAALILNREECKLPSLVRWLQRQLVSSRLYHPLWLAVLYDAVFTVLLPNSCLLLFIIALISFQFTAAFLFISTFNVYMVALLLLGLIVNAEVRRVLRTGVDNLPKINFLTTLKILIATPLTQWVYALALVVSLRMSIVEWRGVTYSISSPWKIRVLNYTPYSPSSDSSHSRISL